MANEYDHPPHFVLIPFMAQGHLIPMVDIAKLLAQRGVTITIVTTPLNAARVNNVTGSRGGLAINLVQVKFPAQEVGLPEGCESIDSLVSMTELPKFWTAANSIEEHVEKLMEEMNPKPICVIGDVNLPFTNNIAKKFKIPKIVFHGFCCFCLLCTQIVRINGIINTVKSDDQYFTVPDLPDRVEFTRPQLSLVTSNVQGDMKEFMDKLMEGDESSYGVIVNTFEELEADYVREYKKTRAGKVWCIGPVSLCNKVGLDKAERGNRAVINQKQCLKWLDSKEPGSVLYVCLGSVCNLPVCQLKELGLGLEESKRSFIWVIRDRKDYNEVQKWISDNRFEERVKSRGLVIKGWAPQTLILSHPSVGGFLTHCGWNSMIEGVSVGLPLLTWPQFGDQFCNEKLVVQILKVGVKAGVEKPMIWGNEEQIGALVDKEGVRRAVEELMGESLEAKERRRRAKELGILANKALEEGGSSHSNITLLIQDILRQVQFKGRIHYFL